MKATLTPLQEQKATFLANRFHAAVGVDPGLGKTLIWLRAAEMVGARNGIVTCPASVRTHWYNFIEEQYGRVGDWHVISYNAGVRKIDGYLKHTHKGAHNIKLRSKYDVWIGDEIHFCKTLESKRTQAIFAEGGIARRAHYKWPGSGTLAPNGRPIELFPMLKALAPEFTGVSLARYAQKYCGAHFDGRGTVMKGASHLDELREKLRNFITFLTWKEAYPNRKEPLIERVPLDLTVEDMKEIYAEEEAIGARDSHLSPRYDDFSQMGDTSRLLRLLGSAKLRSAADFIIDLLTSTDKVLVFCRHSDVMDALFFKFSRGHFNPVLIRGGMGDKPKDRMKMRFILEPACRVAIVQEDVMTGLDGFQRACSKAVDVEPSWTPGVTEQKIRRLARIGQEDTLVCFFMLYARATLDEVKSMVHTRKEKSKDRMFRGVEDDFTTVTQDWGARL